MGKLNTYKELVEENGVLSANKKAIKVILNKYIGVNLNRNSIEENKKNLFYVPPDKCCNFYGFSYGQNGWHPFVKQVEQFIENPNISYEDSVIVSFKDSISRIDINEMVMLDENINFEKYIPNEVLEKANNQREPRPLAPYRTCKDFSNPDKYFYSKPNSIFNEENHFSRLRDVYYSMKEEGYKPEEFSGFSSHYIRGVILKKREDYRFVIMGGRHRAAVFSAIYNRSIPVTFNDNKYKELRHPQILDIKNIENFPIVEEGIYPKSLVKKMFNLYFENDGTERAKYLNLIKWI